MANILRPELNTFVLITLYLIVMKSMNLDCIFTGVRKTRNCSSLNDKIYHV